MRILFVIRSTEYFHYYKSIVRALLLRGHTLRLLFDRRFSVGELLRISQFAEEENFKNANFEYDWSVTRDDFFGKILPVSRDLLSSRRYLRQGELALPLPFKLDWINRLPAAFRWFLKLPGANFLVLSGAFEKSLEALEKTASHSRAIAEDIKKFSPDLVVASPVTFRGSSAETDYLKSAAALNLTTALPVISWDNLTARGLIHTLPTRLLAWNETQKREAIKYMDFPEKRVRVTGAPAFDGWFGNGEQPMGRQEFCGAYGLRAEDPVVLYLGSSRNIVPDEKRLLRDLRSAFLNSKDEKLKKTQIIFRPHPGNVRPYRDFNLEGVLVLPRGGALPEAKEDFKLFYNSIIHSVAVVEINTSGIIDTIVAGKPAIAMMMPKYASSREGTLHFRQLLEAGALEEAKTPEDCVEIIGKLLLGQDNKKQNREAFIKKYIRPLGLGVPAGEQVVLELENLKELSKNKNAA